MISKARRMASAASHWAMEIPLFGPLKSISRRGSGLRLGHRFLGRPKALFVDVDGHGLRLAP